MGMFDSIQVKYPLNLTPELKDLGLNWKEIVFQTKDLESLLWLYEITEDGRLVRSLSDNMFTEDEAVDANGNPIEEPRKWESVNFHGVINFYTTHCDQKETAWNTAAKMSWEDLVQVDGNDWWIEFNAVFDNGRVRSIEVGKVEKTPIRVRLAHQKEWAGKLEEQKAHTENSGQGAQISGISFGGPRADAGRITHPFTFTEGIDKIMNRDTGEIVNEARVRVAGFHAAAIIVEQS